MAIQVKEIMNPEVLSLRAGELASDALGHLGTMQVSGAPVIDGQHRPIGVVSWDALLTAPLGALVSDRMTTPALTVHGDTSVREAARVIAASGHHRLVVIDEHGQLDGMVSALDLLRALVGAPVSHPASFPHHDDDTGLTWSDALALQTEALAEAPAGPGLLLLIAGGVDRPEHLIWAEENLDVRARLHALLTLPGVRPPTVNDWFARGPIRFRCAHVGDPATRGRALDRVLDHALTAEPEPDHAGE